MNVFINNKELINNLYQDAMAYIPALELDAEINLLSNTYYSTIMSLLHFGEGELNFRTGERFKTLKLSPQIITYSNKQLKEWNDRGIVTIDRSIKTIKEFIESGILDKEPVAEKEFRDLRLRTAELLAASQLTSSDVSKIINAFDDIVKQATISGEFGVVTFMCDKLIELKEVRLSASRGTEENIPIWKIIGILIIFGFPIYKSLRCIRKGKCCNTVSGLEGLIHFIAILAAALCHE